jgi:hypothetical protein
MRWATFPAAVWALFTGASPNQEGHGHAGPSLVVKSRKLIRKRLMMRALLMARR